jgi:hypothetical protein
MSQYSRTGLTIRTDDVITTNGTGQITGTILNTLMNDYIDSLLFLDESGSTGSNYYLTGVSGDGNTTGVTFNMSGTTDVVWDASHTHDIYYTKTQSDLNYLSGNTTIGDLDGYTKTEVDNLVYTGDTFDSSLYYNTGETYTKTEVDNLVYTGDTFDSSLYYTKTETDNNYLSGNTTIGDLGGLTESEIYNITGLTNFYTSTQIDNNFLSGNTSLNGLSDVTIDTPLTEDILIYSGDTWINAPAIDIIDIFYTRTETDNNFLSGDTTVNDLGGLTESEIYNITGLTNFYNKTYLDNTYTLDTNKVLLQDNTGTTLNELIKVDNEPTGFVDRVATLSLTGNDLKISGDREFWVVGKRFVKTSDDTITLDTTEGTHYIYYDNTGTLSQTTVFSISLIESEALVSILYYGLDGWIYFGEERHGLIMDGATHTYLHQTVGAKYESGLGLSNFVVDGTGNNNTDATYTLASGVIWDEDIRFISAGATPYLGNKVYYRTGTTWANNVSIIPVMTGGTGRLVWNDENGGDWITTEVTDAKYVLIHLFASTDLDYPVIAIIGQNEYSNSSNAREGATTEIGNLIVGDVPMQELVPLGTIIYQTRSSYSNDVKARVISTDTGDDYISWIGTTITAGVSPSSHQNLTDRDVLDAHTQYTLTGDTEDLKIEQLDFEIVDVAAGTIRLSLFAKYAYDVIDLTAQAETASSTVVSLEIEGTEITGIDSVSITSTESTNTATAAFSVALGETLTLEVESGAEQTIFGSIKLLRT